MGEILSHAEVEAILSGIKPIRSQPALAPVAGNLAGDSRNWTSHDFGRPEPLRGKDLETVHTLHSRLGQKSKSRLESLLKSNVEIHPIGAAQTTAAEFLRSLQTGFTACQFGQQGSEPCFLLVWSAALLRSLLTKMLGGEEPAGRDSSSHPITSIELRLLAKLNEQLLTELSSLLDMELQVTNLLDGAASLPSEIAACPMIWLSYELQNGSTSGLVHVGLPRTASLNPSGKNHSQSMTTLPQGIQKVIVEMSASLASLRMRTSDVASLRLGDVLMTDIHPSDPIQLKLDGQEWCRAAIGTNSGFKALRLVQQPRHRREDGDG